MPAEAKAAGQTWRLSQPETHLAHPDFHRPRAGGGVAMADGQLESRRLRAGDRDQLGAPGRRQIRGPRALASSSNPFSFALH